MRRCDLPARDLRLLDPLFVYPSTILGREKAIVVNLEKIRCIITADELLVMVKGLNGNVAGGEEWEYVEEVQRRLASRSDDLPFEFVALEVALDATSAYLDAQVWCCFPLHLYADQGLVQLVVLLGMSWYLHSCSTL